MIFQTFESFMQQPKHKYSFEILMYMNDILVAHHIEKDKSLVNGTFVKEFTAIKLDDIGSRVQFVVIDTTLYLPGMRPLGFLAWPNNSDTPVLIQFENNSTMNITNKRRNFFMNQFKSCVFEFHAKFINERLLT